MNTPLDPHRLEQLVGRALRDQPLRKAPPALAAHVMAEIARRASVPWWRKSFSHWPSAARIGFLVVSLGVARIAITLMTRISGGPLGVNAVEHATAPVGWLADVLAAATFSQQLLTTIARAVPSTYLYGVTATVVALYLLVFSVSAATYRTLNFSR
jgi:hypothetical protein